MTGLEIYLAVALSFLSVCILSILWHAGGAEKPEDKACWKIKELPSGSYGIYHKGFLTRIWWKHEDKITMEGADKYVKRMTCGLKKYYNSKGNRLE